MNRNRLYRFACASLAAAALTTLCAAPAAAQTLRLTDSSATTLRDGSYANTNLSTATVLETRVGSSSYNRRIQLKFDTHNTIPMGTSIASATLTLTVAGGNSETRQLTLYRGAYSYDEWQATWNSRKSGLHWPKAGGDMSNLVTRQSVSNSAGSKVTFDVTAVLQKIVNGDYSSSSRYARFLVADMGSASKGSYKRYHSDEAGDASVRPVLTISTGTATSTTSTTTTSTTSTTTTAAEIAIPVASAATLRGNWKIASDSTAAGGSRVWNPNSGASKVTTPYASPSDYFEVSFTAEAGRAYRLWIRGKAESDSWSNDSVYVQFSGSLNASGSAVYRIGTTSATPINIEQGSGKGLANWGWSDNGWDSLGPLVYFQTTGTQTMRVQRREDGISIDQIVLSSSKYLTAAPGAAKNDTTILIGGSTSTTTTTTEPVTETSTSTSTTSTLKVFDWNIHHGTTANGTYAVDQQAAFIATTGAHVVSLNEVERYTGWGNEDQPARIASILKSKTGKTWYYKFAQRTGLAKGQGNLLLSVYPFESTGEYLLSYSRSVAQATIIVNGRAVNLFSTHLDADSASRRSTQMSELTRWAAGFAESRIHAGDFNAWPGAWEIAGMTSGHYDTWAEAMKMGTATAYPGNEAGNTRNSRIDYIFLSKAASNVVIKSARVFDARHSSGDQLSDHRPLMTTFEIR